MASARTSGAVERRLKSLQDAFHKEIEDLAADVRRDMVLPVCRRKNLEYRTGNGAFAFFPLGGSNVICDFDADRYGLARVYDTLLLPVSGQRHHSFFKHECLGYFVDDVRKEDLYA